ncbi:MAG TPA: hypothetical protein VKB14_15350 [Actinomycetales bacterium]|nr:hypothetical protein [Actinomycetales bacterium]
MSLLQQAVVAGRAADRVAVDQGWRRRHALTKQPTFGATDTKGVA